MSARHNISERDVVRGFRDPFTYRSEHPSHRIGMIARMGLTNHVLDVERLALEHRNVELHQYLHELMQGGDPRDSEWFKRLNV